MAVKFEPKESFKKIKLEEMIEFIDKNYPEDKEWFKTIAYQDKKGNKIDNYNHLNAVRQFCIKYAPELIKSKKSSASDLFKNW